MKKLRRYGFSLAELLIALAIFSLALSVVFLILRQSVSRIERIQADVFTVLRSQYSQGKSKDDVTIQWAGPKLVCKQKTDSSARFMFTALECKSSQGTHKIHTIIPKPYLDWGSI